MPCPYSIDALRKFPQPQRAPTVVGESAHLALEDPPPDPRDAQFERAADAVIAEDRDEIQRPTARPFRTNSSSSSPRRDADTVSTQTITGACGRPPGKQRIPRYV